MKSIKLITEIVVSCCTLFCGADHNISRKKPQQIGAKKPDEAVRANVSFQLIVHIELVI